MARTRKGRSWAQWLDWSGEKFWALLIFLFVVFPIFWIALTAFKETRDVYTTNVWVPLTLDNFVTIFTPPFNYGKLVLNSFLISTITVAIAIPLGLMAAYVFARYKFRGSQILMVGVLVTQFIPPLVVAIPFYTLFRSLGVTETYLPLVAVYLSIVLPYSVWMLKGFVDALPIEVEEAASVDGCNEFQTLRHITFPMMLPGVITALVFSFIMCWNEFTYALILTGEETRTLQLGLLATVGVRGVLWELMAATGMVVMIPMFILSFTIRKYFVEGLTMGAVK
jgi:multiple sugar transport system permease protein